MKYLYSIIALCFTFLLVFVFAPFGVNSQLAIDEYKSLSTNKLDVIKFRKSVEQKEIDKNSVSSQVAEEGKILFNDGQVKPVAYFSQIGAPWSSLGYDISGLGKTVADSGCGPTTLAIVVRSLLPESNITPRETTLYSLAQGFRTWNSGSSHDLFYKGLPFYGLKFTAIPKTEEATKQALQEGKLVILSVGPGKSPEDGRNQSNTWTGGGHLMALRGLDSSGKILVADPNSKYTTTRPWSFNQSIKPFANGIYIAVAK